jgi:AcrR family transcriptional regulator
VGEDFIGGNMKEDRRVRKTKKALRDGLAELLMEKNIQNITVRELTDKVDINRSTFYANYKDIYDLYYKMENVVIQEINDTLVTDYTFNPKIFFGELLRYISDNKQICRLFFGANVNNSFLNQLSEIFKNLCIDCWCKEYKIVSASEEMEYYAQFYLSGCLGVIGKWVASNFESSVEDLATMLANIDVSFGQIVKSKFV